MQMKSLSINKILYSYKLIAFHDNRCGSGDGIQIERVGYTVEKRENAWLALSPFQMALLLGFLKVWILLKRINIPLPE